LTDPNEQRALETAPTPAERRARFDAFWGRLIGDRRKAARVLRLYYERVEQANLQFTAFKEGWRTDRGMIYILLGPPLAVENHPDEQVWYYTYSDQDPRYRFVFERVYSSAATSVAQFVLRRQPYYYEIWQRLRERWRRGQVL
jgi:GWxTD domain-containing protein